MKISITAFLSIALGLMTQVLQGMTLEEAVMLAWNNSVQLKAQQKQVELSSLDRWRRFVPNEPQFQYSNTDDRTAESLGISETFAFPGKGLAFAKLDKAREMSQLAELRAMKYEITRNIIQVYLDSSVSSALVEEQKKSIADLETLANSLRARYESGLATQPEWTVIELQLRQQKADLLAVQDKATLASIRLKKLLGMNEDTELIYEVPEDIDGSIIAELGNLTADESRAQATIAVAQANKILVWWIQAPDIILSVVKNQYLYLPGSPSGKEQAFNYSLSVTLPLLLPFHERTEARRAQSQAVIDRSVAELQLQAARLDRMDAVREYERSKNRLDELNQKDLPLAESLMESTFSAYKSGKLGIAEIVLARKTVTDLRTQQIQLHSSIVSAHLRALSQGGNFNP